MPAVFIGTMMDAGNVKWRPRFSSGLSDDGPDDQQLIIEFSGVLSNLNWVKLTSYGYAIDLDGLAVAVPKLFDKKWLKNKGLKKADISESGNRNYLIKIQL